MTPSPEGIAAGSVARAGEASNGSGGLGGEASFLREAFSRNQDILSPAEQATLDALCVLVAGCGSVGGSVVEPLARLGVRSFVLADPDVYELSNLNRQACYLADVGRSKPAVLAERVGRVNPYARTVALEEGITTNNYASALDGVDIVFDGMDSPWEKWLLHAEAARRRIPILAGADFGGKPVLYVFDYRRDQRPFYGATRAEDSRDGRFLESVRWLGYRPIPADFLPIVGDRVTTGEPWPQIAYCVAGLGALGSRTVLDVAIGRPVRHVISLDVHQAPRKPLGRLKHNLRWPLAGVKTLSRLVQGPGTPPVPRTLPDLPVPLREALQAARLAPSPHNTQPWRFMVKGPTDLRVDWDRARMLTAGDPDAHGVAYALGCAIEAAAAVTEATFEPAPDGDPRDPDWYAGTLRVERLREDFAAADALVRFRGTTRTPYPDDRLPAATLAELELEAGRHGADLNVLDSRRRIERMGELTGEAAAEQFGDAATLSELLDWIRLRPGEEAESPDGFTPATLALDPASASLMRLLRASPLLRSGAERFGLGATMAEQGAATLTRSGALILLTHRVEGAQDRIRAGRAMMAVWLAAVRAGLAVQPVSFALGGEATLAATREVFGAEEGAEAVALMRLGRATGAPPPSPRLSLDRICDVDRAAWAERAHDDGRLR